MHILILNGSPKGEYSITLQTLRYLEACYPAHIFEVLHVGQKIKSLEKDMAEALEMIKRADKSLHIRMALITEQEPIKLALFVPLDKLSKLAAHKEKLLSRVCHQIGIKHLQ